MNSRKSGTTPLACLNAMLNSNSQAGDSIFYKLPGRISMFTLKRDALQWSRSLTLPVREEQGDTPDGESSGSNEASTLSGADNDGSPEETSSNASCSNESQSKLLAVTRETCRIALQEINEKKRAGMLLPRVVLTPLKVNGARLESSSGRRDGETSSSSSSCSLTLSGSSRAELCRNPVQHLQNIGKSIPDPAKRNRAEEIDCETPGSILVNTNLRALINLRTFSALPHHFQQKLLSLLPEVDRQAGTDGQVRLSSTALNNEFFAHAAQSWRERLADGEFTHEMQTRIRQEVEKEKKVEQWKENFFEDYYGQRLGLTREQTEQICTQQPVENQVEQHSPAEAVRASRRLRDLNCKKHSRLEPRSRPKSSCKEPKIETSPSGEETEGDTESSISSERKLERVLEEERHCRLSAAPDAQSESTSSPSTLPSSSEMLPVLHISDGRVPLPPQDSTHQELKDQKRKCIEEVTASSSFSEKKPRLEDRQSFRNTIECVSTEKPQPTKEEPKVPPIRIHLSRIKQPWVVNGQPAYKIRSQDIPSFESPRRGRSGFRSSANIKTRALHARAQREAASTAIGGGGGPGGGRRPDKGGGGREASYYTRASKRTCRTRTSSTPRTQLFLSNRLELNNLDTLKPLAISLSADENLKCSVQHFNLALKQDSDLSEINAESLLDFKINLGLHATTVSDRLSDPPSEGSLQNTKVSRPVIGMQDTGLYLQSSNLNADCNLHCSSQETKLKSIVLETENLHGVLKGPAFTIVENVQNASEHLKKTDTFDVASSCSSSELATSYSRPAVVLLNGIRLNETGQNAAVCLKVSEGVIDGTTINKRKTTVEKVPEMDSIMAEVSCDIHEREGIDETTVVESLSLHVTLEGLSDQGIALEDLRKTCREIKKQVISSVESVSLCQRESSNKPSSEGEPNSLRAGTENVSSHQRSGEDALDSSVCKVDEHVKTFREEEPSCSKYCSQTETFDSGAKPLDLMINASGPCSSLMSTFLTNSQSPFTNVNPISSIKDPNLLTGQLLQNSSMANALSTAQFAREPKKELSLPFAAPTFSISGPKLLRAVNAEAASLFPRQEEVKGQPSPLNGFHFVSGDLSQELLKGVSEQGLPENLSLTAAISPSSPKSQEIPLSFLETPTALSSDMIKKESHGCAHPSDAPRRLTPRTIFLQDAVSDDESYPDVQDINLLDSELPGNVSTSQALLRASRTMQANVLCARGHGFLHGGTHGGAQEDWLPEDYQHDFVSMKNNLPILTSSLRESVQNQIENPISPVELKDFQGAPLVIDLADHSISRGSVKCSQRTLESSSLPSQPNIKKSLYGKLLKLNRGVCHCAAASGLVPRFSKNFALQLRNHPDSTTTSLSVQMFAQSAGVEQISLHCSCRLKAMIMCKGCGAFCHDDCIGPSKLCILCLVVR
ncbi:polycomb group protein ASXL1 isoform X2 [Pleurodeles waltl]|uniref:polycomb group protein ASXL1 isoform X2 n=1 Tax=Pleurodeles waltl TaxID=8319 RepID=UPI0037095CCD